MLKENVDNGYKPLILSRRISGLRNSLRLKEIYWVKIIGIDAYGKIGNIVIDIRYSKFDAKNSIYHVYPNILDFIKDWDYI